MKSQKVVFVDEGLEKSYDEFSDEDPLKKALKRAINDIWENIFCGRNVKKKLIPKELIQKYRINNLWIYNLPSGWRLLYAITPLKKLK